MLNNYKYNVIYIERERERDCSLLVILLDVQLNIHIFFSRGSSRNSWWDTEARASIFSGVIILISTSSSHGQSVFGWKVKFVWNRWYTLRVHIRRTVTDCKNSRNRWTETIEVRFFHSPSSSFFTLPISLSDHADQAPFFFPLQESEIWPLLVAVTRNNSL